MPGLQLERPRLHLETWQNPAAPAPAASVSDDEPDLEPEADAEEEEEEPTGNQHGMICPSCGSDERIAIRALIWTAQDGSDSDGDTPDHDHEWDRSHDTACMACGWRGKAGNIEPDAVAPDLFSAVVFYGDGGVARVD